MAVKTYEGGLARLSSCMAPMFGGASPTFLSDSKTVVDTLNSNDVPARHFNEMPMMTKTELANVVMVPLQFDTTPTGKDIERYLGRSSMLVLPIASFCGSPHGALYFCEKLGHVDVSTCVRGVIGWLDTFSTADTIHMVGAGTDIAVTLGDEIYAMSPKSTTRIQPGEWCSISQYLEVGLVSYRATNRPHHRMEGVLMADGACVSYHRYAAPHIAGVVDRTWTFLESVREQNPGEPFVVEVRDSQVVSVSCGEREIYPQVAEFANKKEHPYVGEFAFATGNEWEMDTVDWSINSQLNEAIGGIHIGFGNGVNGAHIDFVAPRAVMVSGAA